MYPAVRRSSIDVVLSTVVLSTVVLSMAGTLLSATRARSTTNPQKPSLPNLDRPLYDTLHSSRPPTLFDTASRMSSTPLDVLTIRDSPRFNPFT